ncbi:phage tail protein [Actinoplanes sp. NPDC026623]|uniref:phage tail protein n=1 Tax=Actinoplanes sp. NPDC026623 TaxID=3155610 RepID=UPI0033F6514D
MTGERDTLHALLSAGGWDVCRLDGLDVRPDGRVELAAVPALVPPSLNDPAAAGASGLALDARCGLYLSDADGRRVIRLALDRGDRLVLSGDGRPGPPILVAPAGLCIGPHGWLFVADPGRGAVLVLHAEQLSLRDEWRAGLVRPVGVAADRQFGLYVLDAAAGRVLRLDATGEPDAAFAGRMMPPTGPVRPTAIASDDDGRLYVGDAGSESVLVYGPDGAPAGPALAEGAIPQALAVAGDRLYVGDRSSGRIQLFAIGDGRALGEVAGFRGPISALAADRGGRLYLKPGGDQAYRVAEPGAGRIGRGTVEAGPLDAGEEGRWSRVAVEAETPADTGVLVETASAADAAAPPRWRVAAAPDLLLDGERFLWIRLTLQRLGPETGGITTPSLIEARAESGGETYLDYLPLVYARDGGDFLRRLLALAQSDLGDREAAIEQLFRSADPQTAPAGTLATLASWQAFELPSGAGDAERRRLLAELPELYRIRGTPHGVARFIEIHTGVRPLLVESFRSRRAWMLDGGSSGLGFDSALPASAPDGLVVGSSVVGAGGPQDPDGFARSVFDDTAHRFTVGVPVGSLSPAERRRVGEILDAEKPAHTQYHLCFWQPRFRVGVQAHVGVDTIVAGPPAGLVLDDDARLDRNAWTAGEPTGAVGSVGRLAHLGVDTVVG